MANGGVRDHREVDLWIDALVANFREQQERYLTLLELATTQRKLLKSLQPPPPLTKNGGSGGKRAIVQDPSVDSYPTEEWEQQLDVLVQQKNEIIGLLDKLNDMSLKIRSALGRELQVDVVTISVLAAVFEEQPTQSGATRPSMAQLAGRRRLEALRQATDGLAAVMQELEAVEARNATQIQAHMASIHEATTRMQRGRSVAKAYGEQPESTDLSRFLDRKR